MKFSIIMQDGNDVTLMLRISNAIKKALNPFELKYELTSSINGGAWDGNTDISNVTHLHTRYDALVWYTPSMSCPRYWNGKCWVKSYWPTDELVEVNTDV